MYKKNIKKYYWFFLLGGAVCLIFWNIYYFNTDLKKNGILLNGQIIGISTTYRGSPKYEYQYVYNKIAYVDQDASGIKKLNSFIGKTFPVIFSPKTRSSKLLMTPEKFEKYDITFPDSLRWVLNYLDK